MTIPREYRNEQLEKKRTQCLHGGVCRWILEICTDCKHYKELLKKT